MGDVLLSKYIDHACECCGAVRKVRADKLAKGIQKLCRKCQGPAAAEKRRAALLKRGGQRKTVEYWTCKECSVEYQVKPVDDTGFCSDQCKERAEARGCSMNELANRFLFGRALYPRSSIIAGGCKKPLHWEQIGLPFM